MQTLTREALIEAQGTEVVDQDGEKIGAVEDVYYVEGSDQAEWIGIGTGLFGLKRRVVPVDGAQLEDGALRVPYSKEQVKDSPDVDDETISEDDERALYAYYGVATSHGLAADVRTVRPTVSGATDDEDEVGTGAGDIGLRPPHLDPEEAKERQTGVDEGTAERLREERRAPGRDRAAGAAAALGAVAAGRGGASRAGRRGRTSAARARPTPASPSRARRSRRAAARGRRGSCRAPRPAGSWRPSSCAR